MCFIYVLNLIFSLFASNVQLFQASRRLSITRRFNLDRRYACLIASTRAATPRDCGGGGAGDRPEVDGVILLDSDWCPTVAASVQKFLRYLAQERSLRVYRYASAEPQTKIAD